MTTQPTISIAMATYNGARFLTKQLDSLLYQTYPPHEIIICDDRSTDETSQILLSYAQKDPRITVIINETNLGFIKNFEKAMVLCQGDLIALADQDDIWLETKLATLVGAMGESSLICSTYTMIDEEDRPLIPTIPLRTRLHLKLFPFAHHRYSFETSLYFNFVTGCTAMFKRELLTKALPIPNEVGYHDWWIATIALHEKGIVYLQDPLIFYRQHTNNHTGTKGWEKQSYAKLQQRRLAWMKQSPLFCDNEKKLIGEAYLYYTDQLTSKYPFKALFLGIKNHRMIWPDSSPLSKIKALFRLFFSKRL